jgi:hypothetical protein
MIAAEWIGSINWAGWSFVLLIVAGFLYLLRLNNDTSKFRLVDLITDSEGRGYSPSFTYVGCFIVGAWLCWYFAVSKEYTESAATFGAMLTGFVVGSVWRGNTAAKERMAALNSTGGDTSGQS